MVIVSVCGLNVRLNCEHNWRNCIACLKLFDVPWPAGPFRHTPIKDLFEREFYGGTQSFRFAELHYFCASN